MTISHTTFFHTLCDEPSNANFLRFADLLDAGGKSTQAQLVRAALRLRDDLTPQEREALQVPSTMGESERAAHKQAYAELESKFIDELGPKIASHLKPPQGLGDGLDWAYSGTRIEFDRGVINHLDLGDAPSVTSIPADLQILKSLDVSYTGIGQLRNVQVGGDLLVSGTAIFISGAPLAQQLCSTEVRGNIYAFNTQITPESAKELIELNSLSSQAKVSCLRSCGYAALADAVERGASQQVNQLPTWPC